MSRDRRTVYVGIEHGEWQNLLSYSWTAGQWHGPEEVLGSPSYTAQDPFLTQDERRLFFITRVNGNADIGFIRRDEFGQWASPSLLGAPINGLDNEYFVSITKEGDIVFASDRDRSQEGDYNIYRSSGKVGGYQQPAALPASINTGGYEADPFIDPDGRYLLFASNRRGGQGRGDIYLSVAEPDGGWSKSIPFDERVNTPAHELCPMVSLDGSALMFTSNQDIYWVSAAIIDDMIATYRAQQSEGIRR